VTNVSPSSLNWISSYIWGIADDVLRDVFNRGKYRDVILPMTVIRRFDAVLEPTKQNVLAMAAQLEAAKVDDPDLALRQASGQAFYNTSKFTLRDLKAITSQQQLEADFVDYLDGFSPNVQQIIENFEFRQRVPKLSRSDSLGVLLERLLSPKINLGPEPVLEADGSVRLPGLDNHAMGTVFEELIRRFNEDNNEEAGEHWTPRDAVKLMTNLIFLPIKDQIQSGTYLLYDGALGTGGMLTVADETLRELTEATGKDVVTHLYGQEINPESFAIAKADLLIKGEDADDIVGGEEYSTLSNDAFAGREFDFMLSNPPYGKSWKVDLERMGGKAEMSDPRFVVEHDGDGDFSLVTRSSDGQLLFLANMVSKMKQDSPLGSRIAEVHNGSSLFTGDAGQGESNIRRWVIENDWLEAIVALPLNMFYNTGIATYIWVLTNRKSEERKGKVQLIDATKRFTPLRKNLGNKNCELSDADTAIISDVFLKFEECEVDGVESQIFRNEDFGYWKVTVERPLRVRSQITLKAIEELRYASGDAALREELYDEFGDELATNFASVKGATTAWLDDWRDPNASDADGEDEDSASGGLSAKTKKKLLEPKHWARDHRLVETSRLLQTELGDEVFDDHNVFRARAKEALKNAGAKIPATDLKLILKAVSWRDDEAPPVVAKVFKPGAADPDPMAGRFEIEIDGKSAVVEYEADSDLRDQEQVPLMEEGGIQAFIEREVLPYTPDAWIKEADAKIGYEISFNRYFYKPAPLRSLDEIRADILAVEKEAEGLLDDILGSTAAS
jgi:type I restriction enzyme M protein